MRPPPPRRRAQGTTLVELLVFSGLALLMVLSVWSFFSAFQRGTHRTFSGLDGVAAGIQVSRRLELDLAHLHESRRHPPRIRRGPEETILEFTRFGPESPGDEWTSLPLVRIRYRLHHASGVVTRQEGNAAPRELPGRIGALDFQFLRGRGSPEASLLTPAPAVLFTVHGQPGDPGQEGGVAPLLLLGGRGRERVSSHQAYPSWNPLPFGDGS